MPDNQNSSEWRVPDDYLNQASGYRAGWADAMACKPAPAMLNGAEDTHRIVSMLNNMNGFHRRDSVEWDALDKAQAILRAADNRDAAGVVLSNDGTSEAQFIADGENLNCPRCGGSGHVGDTPTAAPAGEAVAWLTPKSIAHLAKQNGVAIVPAWNCSNGSERVPVYTHPPAAEVREVDRG